MGTHYFLVLDGHGQVLADGLGQRKHLSAERANEAAEHSNVPCEVVECVVRRVFVPPAATKKGNGKK